VRGLTAAGAMPEPSAGSLGDNLIEIEAGAHVIAA
jgi:hypothetical protein